jgi:small subunit ribosomal protein S7
MNKKVLANKPCEIGPDVVFGDESIQRMINSIIYDGKKNIAAKIVYSALDKVMKSEIGNTLESPKDLMKKLISKAKPNVEVVSRRIKGATFPVPTEVKPGRASMLAIRWVREGARKRGIKMDEAVSQEIMSVLTDKACYTLRRREEVHQAAKANRAFLHFRRDK